MNPLKLLLILRYRYKIALVVALLVTAIGAGVSVNLPKRYSADTFVMVDVRSPDPLAALLSPTGVAHGTMGTQVDIIKSDRVARKVVRILRLDENPAVVRMWQESTQGKGQIADWMANLLQKGLKVTPSRESSLIGISYQGSDPAFVATVANAYAQAYVEASVELKVEPARQYARWFGDQAKVLRENVEKAQTRLSAFQQSKGIVVTEATMDYELMALNELSSRLTAAQGETRDAQIKQRSGKGGMNTLPEVMNNTVVAGLRSKVADLEAKVKEAGGNLGTQHPQYLRMESELAELKARLAAESSHVASGYGATGAVGRSREAELRDAIEVQKKKLLVLRSERDEIAVLVRDVDTAKRAYEAVTNRYNQTSLESQITQTNVSVLTPAIEPIVPSFPKPLPQMLLMVAVLGILLGCGAAFGLEMLDRRIRSPEDLAEMLQLPVLAVIQPSRRPRRLGFQRVMALLPATK
ncbi:MAG: chain length determinant protein EpsF [Candidatus Parcubacteria bacterium]|nr:chain length determinant protein EpsF [Burkholderiales bacterium]